MNILYFSADAEAARIPIGIVAENGATQIQFDCSQFVTDHGSGTAEIVHKRPSDTVGYKCLEVTQDDATVSWTVTNDDTAYSGKGRAQLRWYVDDVLKESRMFTTYIYPSLTASEDEPETVRSALDLLLEAIQDIDIPEATIATAIETYLAEHPISAPVDSVNGYTGTVVLSASDVSAYTTTEVDALLEDKADSATTLAGYGITDAYTTTETDTLLSAKASTDVATTSSDGLMSSTDKANLDTLYADYSSALTALGVS